MLKRIVPVGVLAAALLLATSATLARATDDSTSNYQLSRTRDSATIPGDRIEPTATGDDDMPNRTVRRPGPMPGSSAVTPGGESPAARAPWYLLLWQKLGMFGSKVVFLMKA